MSTREVAEEVNRIQNVNAVIPTVDIDKHEADKVRREAEREKTRQLREDCLDPEVAAKYELEKPRYEWSVRAKWLERTETKPHKLAPVEFASTVIAPTESDAWASFCDQIGRHPGRKKCRELEIVRGKQISVSEFAASQSAVPFSQTFQGNNP